MRWRMAGKEGGGLRRKEKIRKGQENEKPRETV